MPEVMRAEEAGAQTGAAGDADDRSERIDKTACQQPGQCERRQCVEKRPGGDDGYPAGRQVEQSLKPVRRPPPGDRIDRDSDRRQSPDHPKKAPSPGGGERQEAEWGVGSGDKGVDGGAVQAEEAVFLPGGEAQQVVERTGGVEKDECRSVDGKGHDLPGASARGEEQKDQGDHGQQDADQMGQAAKRVFQS